MKKIVLSSFLMLFISLSFAQNSLLWKISGNNLETPSYLFGTIHVICPDDFFLPETLIPRLEQCQQVLLEIDMTDPTLMQKMQSGMMNPKMKNIKGDLTTEDLKAVDEALKLTMGVGVDQMGILKPWALSTILSIQLCLDCKQPAQYEVKIMELAKAKQLPIAGLETVEEQLAMFDNVSYEEQLELLLETVNSIEKNKALFTEMVETYKEQDTYKLYEFIMQQDDMEEFAEFLLDNRNTKWIPVIESHITKQACFIAVGAGHLGGEKGLIMLLKKEGYTVEAVN